MNEEECRDTLWRLPLSLKALKLKWGSQAGQMQPNLFKIKENKCIFLFVLLQNSEDFSVSSCKQTDSYLKQVVYLIKDASHL